MRYDILSGETIIGFTEFESGDPPMGVVTGEFFPSESYASNYDYEGLRALVSGTSELIAFESIVIEDYSEEFGEEVVEITALVVSAEEYEKHFNHHYEAYRKQFE
ncbi:hypothetical protein [Photobacterium halotolerans]|uniref:hypothetical protein n=1 Tax=Photobacterium halotolerans TaxID=265726 RepID=UPI0013735C22|nr:hypothetical protein [Photobacterium halotolerans]NAW84926.1 hypothetical protein [Photobacterium halotolerans]